MIVFLSMNGCYYADCVASLSPSIPRGLMAPNRHQTQSYDPISCYGNSVELTNEIACRI